MGIHHHDSAVSAMFPTGESVASHDVPDLRALDAEAARALSMDWLDHGYDDLVSSGWLDEFLATTTVGYDTALLAPERASGAMTSTFAPLGRTGPRPARLDDTADSDADAMMRTLQELSAEMAAQDGDARSRRHGRESDFDDFPDVFPSPCGMGSALSDFSDWIDFEDVAHVPVLPSRGWLEEPDALTMVEHPADEVPESVVSEAFFPDWGEDNGGATCGCS